MGKPGVRKAELKSNNNVFPHACKGGKQDAADGSKEFVGKGPKRKE